MYKLLLLILMSVVYLAMYALQTDEEVAMHTLFQGKYALNRAAHAAAQQSDQEKLALGIHSIEESRAKTEALRYLQTNLRLDGSNNPLPGTFLRSRVALELFKVVNDGEEFPYTYSNAEYGYSVTLNRPGVIMIVRLEFPRTYAVLQPISWSIKGSAEMVY
ncbi:hypothetical protein [Paenibacillus sp. SI8]|uniref:hypothetical protein n=1 Tax=unclassified Paenibacillus TaxID=185978 RepID=UPI00346668C2